MSYKLFPTNKEINNQIKEIILKIGLVLNILKIKWFYLNYRNIYRVPIRLILIKGEEIIKCNFQSSIYLNKDESRDK